MAEKQPTNDEALALSGSTDPDYNTGAPYPTDGQDPWAAAFYKFGKGILRALHLANNLRVFEVEGNADAVGVRPGRCTIASTVYAFSGADPAVDGLTDNDTTYVWAEDDGGGNLQINSATDGTGWPGGDHFKLAEITMSSGAITDIVDRRLDEIFSV